MSAGVVNSSILLGLSIAIGLVSLVVQVFFWPRGNVGVFNGAMKALSEVWREIVESLTIWNPSNPEYKNVTFVRMSVTFVLLLGIVAIVLATYDSVTSFWIYFILYLGVGLLAVPIIGHVVSYIFRRPPQTMMSDQ